jgi:hydrogenase maturation protease
MTPAAAAPVRIIGIGNEWAGDDAVGLVITRRLRSLLGAEAEVIEAGAAGLDLLDLFDRVRPVILIDGIAAGARPGTIHRVDLATQPVPRTMPCSTHAFGLAEVLELARVMEQLPPKISLYGVEIEQVAPGAELSPAVARAVEETIRLICRELTGAAHA